MIVNYGFNGLKLWNQGAKVCRDSVRENAQLNHSPHQTPMKIKAALDGQTAGCQTNLLLQPEDAIGLRDEGLAQTMPRRDFPPGVKVGGQLQGRSARRTGPRPCAWGAWGAWASALVGQSLLLFAQEGDMSCHKQHDE